MTKAKDECAELARLQSKWAMGKATLAEIRRCRNLERRFSGVEIQTPEIAHPDGAQATGAVVDHGLHSKPVVDHEAANLRDNAAGVPVVQPQQEKNVELPDAIRVPLDELEADAAYIIGRVAVDGSCSGIMVEAIRKRTRAIREALLAHGAQGSARDHNEVMALVYLYGSHCAEHPEDAAGQQERLAGVKTALGVDLPDGSKR